MADDNKKTNELPLPPGTYAYVLDSTKGQIKLYVGPTVINKTGQDRPVKYNPEPGAHRFEECSLEEAMQQNFVVPEGFYAVLTNPAVIKGDNKLQYPAEGSAGGTPDLAIGLKVNIPGPISFALFPGQTCEVRRGHHLRSNEYLRIKIYNEDKARENWSKAIIKPAEGVDAKAAGQQVPRDLAVGRTYNVLGTEYAFYIPPTGVSVVPESVDETGRAVFVREAVTLEKLEYSILVDENGRKEYPQGPKVVFPEPTQQFIHDREENRKFRAIEMNELQGIQLKLITDCTFTFADGSKHDFKAGEEVFITGKEMPIYYPEDAHQLVRYDGKTIHYAVAVPEGEARYVMNRKTGEIKTVLGPDMLLPNPITEIIVRRALSDGESVTWFPGADGKGSADALAYNRALRAEAVKEPTTRQGVVSEGRIGLDSPVSGSPMMSLGGDSEAMNVMLSNYAGGVESPALERFAASAPIRRTTAKASKMAESRQGKKQEAVLADVAERKSTFNEPRMITFANKYKGVPTIKVQQGYAVQIADASGKREVVIGPKTKFLDWDETLDVLALSTGKPKTADGLLRTAYLNIYNNAVTDVIALETSDLVQLQLKLSYRVNFEGASEKWFSIENYVKHLCDRIRSMIKSVVKQQTVEQFYKNAAVIVRDAILGKKTDGEKRRPGLAFEENGMRVADVEVLGVEITDPAIKELLSKSQREVVQQNIQLALAKSKLDATREQELIARAEADAKTATLTHRLSLEQVQMTEQLKVDLAKFVAQLQRHEKEREICENKEKLADFLHGELLARTKDEGMQREEFAKLEAARREAELQAQTHAIVEQMRSVDPHLVAALDSATARETLIEVAGKLSVHAIAGAPNVVEFLQNIFANTPLSGLMAKTLASAALPANGSAPKPEART